MAAISTSHEGHGSMLFDSNEMNLLKGSFPKKNQGSNPLKLPSLATEPTTRVSSPGPLPLPSFVFPVRAVPSLSSPSSAPSSLSRAAGRRPLSVFELSGASTASTMQPAESDNKRPALPSFSFGMQSPPLSPQLRALPNRHGSHKRGTSEFIGGDGKTGSGMGLMSTSPTKGDGALPSPTFPPSFGPGPGRRGHAHRRSQAISHDMTMILKTANANTTPRGGSAPTSPSDQEHHQSPFPGSLDSAVQPANADTKTFHSETSPPMKPFNLNRARVGFSDDVQIIPRPLSLVSSDSSSTMTVRQGHSVSGSVASVISTGASSPPSKEQRELAPVSNQRGTDARPRTAEPILDRETSRTPGSPAPRRRNSIPLLMEAAATSAAGPSTPKSARKWTFFGHESASGESSPKSRPASSASEREPKSVAVESASPSAELATLDVPITSIEQLISRRSSISRKPSKKQKRVKSWAGSILSRKSRPRKQKALSKRSPTPPLRTYVLAETQSFDFNQPQLTSAPGLVKPELKTDFTTWKPRHIPTQDDESMSPIIDLDAALGPFNTPSGYDRDWELSQKGSGCKRRAMHSAAGKSGFLGPGMHYHRRAESAPEFENPRFVLHRLGSSSTMGEVFEDIDEEEDDWQDTKTTSDKDSSIKLGDDDESGLGIDIKVVDAEDTNADKTMDWTIDDPGSLQRGVKRKGSGLSEGDRRHVGSSAKSEHSCTSIIDEPILEESPSRVEIVNDSRPESRAQSSDSTATPPFRPRPAKDLEIQAYSLQQPYPTPSSSTTQSFPHSPRSPFSYDAQRISTAPSSITDEHGGFQSLLLGEPGPELRISVDDVPSLTSSNSTMTRESVVYPGAHNPQFRDGQRSASLSSAAATRKRSSMASLSRLISSSHGEKSKLSIESRPSTSDAEKKDKGSKSKRISRMMQFWKSKDSP